MPNRHHGAEGSVWFSHQDRDRSIRPTHSGQQQQAGKPTPVKTGWKLGEKSHAKSDASPASEVSPASPTADSFQPT
jgi:hypothetical protein